MYPSPRLMSYFQSCLVVFVIPDSISFSTPLGLAVEIRWLKKKQNQKIHGLADGAIYGSENHVLQRFLIGCWKRGIFMKWAIVEQRGGSDFLMGNYGWMKLVHSKLDR